MENTEIEKLNDEYLNKKPQEILKKALEGFDNIALACSYGPEDVALYDMIVKIKPDANIFYLDTGFLFDETYELIDKMKEKYGNGEHIEKYENEELSIEEQKEKYGDKLWEKDPEKCCNLRKIVPLKKALSKLDAWITGIRREQSPTRAESGVFEVDKKFGLVKVNPLALWKLEEVWEYIKENDVPYNPLHDKNYPSIGCEPCTNPVKEGEDFRAGRWKGFKKTECGLHK